jgi:hypothetical protein
VRPIAPMPHVCHTVIKRIEALRLRSHPDRTQIALRPQSRAYLFEKSLGESVLAQRLQQRGQVVDRGKSVRVRIAQYGATRLQGLRVQWQRVLVTTHRLEQRAKVVHRREGLRVVWPLGIPACFERIFEQRHRLVVPPELAQQQAEIIERDQRARVVISLDLSPDLKRLMREAIRRGTWEWHVGGQIGLIRVRQARQGPSGRISARQGSSGFVRVRQGASVLVRVRQGALVLVRVRQGSSGLVARPRTSMKSASASASR